MMIPKTSLLETSGPSAVGTVPVSSTAVALTLTTSTADTERTYVKWVRCFGFPPGEADIVIGYFQDVLKLTIVDYQPREDKSANWIHVKFDTQKETAIALGINNTVIEANNNRIMIGVALYPEGDQLDAQAKASGSVNETSRPSTNIKPGGGPQRATSVWQKATAWIMDM